MRGEVDFVLFIEKEDYEVAKDDPSFKSYSFPADYYYAIVYDSYISATIAMRMSVSFGNTTMSCPPRVSYAYIPG
jgi:hypothetical protein